MDLSRTHGGADLAYPKAIACQPWRAWLVHLFTAGGLVAGLLSLLSVFNGDPTAAIGWLLVGAVMDGVDGPVARAWGVAEALPQIDGCMLDMVVDFVGCVVAPFAFLWRFNMLPSGVDFAVVSIGFVTSALWYARNDQMTADGWFNGFPAGWNLMVPTLFLLGSHPLTNASFVMLLAVLQLTSVKFVHPMRVVELRTVTVAVTVLWIVAIAVMTELSPALPAWGALALWLGPVYQAVLSLRRTVAGDPVPAG